MCTSKARLPKRQTLWQYIKIIYKLNQLYPGPATQCLQGGGGGNHKKNNPHTTRQGDSLGYLGLKSQLHHVSKVDFKI